MNEMYAAEPTFARTAMELKLFLNQFGPTTGRYLASIPYEWRRDVERAFAEAGPLEQKRISETLNRAKKRFGIIHRTDFQWNPKLAWRENASNLASPSLKKIVAGVIQAGEDGPLPEGIIAIDELNLDATAEEEIEGTPSEFDRVCKMVIGLKGDIHIVDPLLDPCKSGVRKVLEPLVKRMNNSRVSSLTIWTRASKLLIDRTEAQLEQALQRLSTTANSAFPIKLNLLDDHKDMRKRMHARCLFSINAGVAIDNGFQELTGGGRTKVTPMSEATLDIFIKRYKEDLDHAPIETSIQMSSNTR
jgi:hypothetical protein